MAGEGEALLLGLDDRFGFEVLRTGKEVKTLEAQFRVLSDLFEQLGYLFGVDAELLRAAARITSYNVCYTKLLRGF